MWRVRRLRLQWKREGRRRASIVHSRRNVVWKDFIAREGEGEQRVRKGLGEERALNECERKEGKLTVQREEGKGEKGEGEKGG